MNYNSNLELAILLDELAEVLRHADRPISSEIKVVAKGLSKQLHRQFEEHQSGIIKNRICHFCKQSIAPKSYLMHVSDCGKGLLIKAKKAENEALKFETDEKMNNTQGREYNSYNKEMNQEREADGSRDYYKYNGGGDGKWISHPSYDNMDDESDS